MLQCKCHIVADTVVADFIAPALCEGPEFEDTAEQLHGLIGPAKNNNLIIDLSRVRFIASKALSLLMELKHAVALHGGAFIICGSRQEIQQVFKISGLDRHLTLFATRDEALAALSIAV